jgi:hypothetical protein
MISPSIVSVNSERSPSFNGSSLLSGSVLVITISGFIGSPSHGRFIPVILQEKEKFSSRQDHEDKIVYVGIGGAGDDQVPRSLKIAI